MLGPALSAGVPSKANLPNLAQRNTKKAQTNNANASKMPEADSIHFRHATHTPRSLDPTLNAAFSDKPRDRALVAVDIIFPIRDGAATNTPSLSLGGTTVDSWQAELPKKQNNGALSTAGFHQ